MPWNIRIWTLYGAFVIFMVGLVVLAYNQNFELVAKDYYSLELQYQNKIDKINNTRPIKDQFSFKVNKGNIVLQIPNKIAGSYGKVIFFKPSDEKSDREFDITAMNGEDLTLSTTDLSAGKYKLTIDWQHQETAYILEEIVLIP
jgi:hypothetical protein